MDAFSETKQGPRTLPAGLCNRERETMKWTCSSIRGKQSSVMVDSLLLSPSLQHLCYDHLPTSISVINLSGMVTLCHYKCTQLWRAMKRTNQNINLSMLCRLSALFVLLLVMSKLGFKCRRKATSTTPPLHGAPREPVYVWEFCKAGEEEKGRKGRQKEEGTKGSRGEKAPAWWVCGTLEGKCQAP